MVLAELFTGENPLVPSTNIKEPIRLKKLAQITGTQDGGLVFKLLRSMLTIDYKERAKVDDLLNSFNMLYEKVGA